MRATCWGAAVAREPAYTDLVYELACCALAAGLLERCLELGDAGPRYLGTVGAGGALASELLRTVKSGESRPITSPDSTHLDGGANGEWDLAARRG